MKSHKYLRKMLMKESAFIRLVAKTDEKNSIINNKELCIVLLPR